MSPLTCFSNAEQYTVMKNKLLMNKTAVDQEMKQKDNINLWKNLPDV